MTGLIYSRLPRQLIETRWLEYLALFLIVVGARLWLVSLYGSSVPFMDQWDDEGATLFKPWLEGTLRLSDLFQPHNEHRIVPFATPVPYSGLGYCCFVSLNHG
jgi:hypothetical protein